MPSSSRSAAAFALATALALLTAFACASARAHHTPEHSRALGEPTPSAPGDTIEGVSAEACWIRTMPAQVPSAAYFTLRNATGQSLTLTDVRTEAFGRVMMHGTEKRGGMAKMKMVHDLPVPPRDTLTFEPGGLHVMLERPARKLTVGETVSLQLIFARGATLDVPCELRPAATVAH